jgi:hypothetical protein
MITAELLQGEMGAPAAEGEFAPALRAQRPSSLLTPATSAIVDILPSRFKRARRVAPVRQVSARTTLMAAQCLSK